MLTLQGVVRERKNLLRQIAKGLKEIDTALEKAQRLVSRVLNRRRKVPETADLQAVVDIVLLIVQIVGTISNLSKAGFVN